MSYEVITPPDEEPVSLLEAKAHCRIDHNDEDDWLSSRIVQARRKVEQEAWRTLVTTEMALYLDEFPRVIWWTLPPLQEVTSIEYHDVAGDLQTVDEDDYHVDAKRAPGRIVLANGAAWPTVQSGRPNAVIVTAEAGYGNAGNVPEEAKHAMLLLIGHWYLHRETVLSGTISKELEFAYSNLIEQLKWTRHALIDC